MDQDKTSPQIDIDMTYDRFVVIELAGSGFGSPEALENERSDLIADAYDYLKFKNKYETQCILLTRKKHATR